MFNTTLQSAIHDKPSSIKVYTVDEINDMPVRSFAHSLEQQYLTAPKLSERDKQIRFAEAIYNDIANLSDVANHDITSQIVLFYYVLLYGWTRASKMCSQVITKPTLNCMQLDLKNYRAHNAVPTMVNTRQTRAPSSRRQAQNHTEPTRGDHHRATAQAKGVIIQVPAPDANYPEEETNILQRLALQQLSLVDINNIAVVDTHTHNQYETPLTLISDRFWTEFNEWRQKNQNAYDTWLSSRDNPQYDAMPAGDNTPAHDQISAGDNAPAHDTNRPTGDNALWYFKKVL